MTEVVLRYNVPVYVTVDTDTEKVTTVKVDTVNLDWSEAGEDAEGKPIEDEIVLREAYSVAENSRWPQEWVMDYGAGERIAPAFGDEMACEECGGDMWVDDQGVAYHWGSGPDNINHDTDADHVAVPPREDAS